MSNLNWNFNEAYILVEVAFNSLSEPSFGPDSQEKLYKRPAKLGELPENESLPVFG